MGPQGGSDPLEVALLAVLHGRVSPLNPLWNVRHLGTRETLNKICLKFIFKCVSLYLYIQGWLSVRAILPFSYPLRNCCTGVATLSRGSRAEEAPVTEQNTSRNYGTSTLCAIRPASSNRFGARAAETASRNYIRLLGEEILNLKLQSFIGYL